MAKKSVPLSRSALKHRGDQRVKPPFALETTSPKIQEVVVNFDSMVDENAVPTLEATQVIAHVAEVADVAEVPVVKSVGNDVKSLKQEKPKKIRYIRAKKVQQPKTEISSSLPKPSTKAKSKMMTKNLKSTPKLKSAQLPR